MPVGWHISVYRQVGGGSEPGEYSSDYGPRLAVWQASIRGLDWILQLRGEGKAKLLGGDGYPVKFTAMSSDVLPHLEGEPPSANEVWVYDSGDKLLPGWAGRTLKDEEVIRACSTEEWLLIVAWDES